MAGEYNIGSSGAGFDDTIARAQRYSGQIDELNQKEAGRRAAEERTAATEEGSATVRTSLARATTQLSTALTHNTTTLGLETEAIAANTAALRSNLELRSQMARTPVVTAGSEVAYGPASGGGGGGTRPPVVTAAGGFQEDPNAGARLSAAQRALAEAEIAASAARAEVSRATRRAGASAGDVEPLVAQRDLANQQLGAARTELRAAQANAAAQQQLATAKRQSIAEQDAINAALAAERVATERSAVEARAMQVRAAGAAASRASPLQLGPGRAPLLLEEGGLFHMPAAPLTGGPASSLADMPRPRTFYAGGGPGWHGVTTGGPTESVGLPADADAAKRMAAYRAEASANATTLGNLERAQREANMAVRESGAIYADASTRLTRHGALTTEFIGALARGQVTLGEFGQQLVATIGKFGGWAIAGAAVFGVVGAMRDLFHGATETQAAVEQLGRFIPGLGGPAGGGTGQRGAAGAAVRDISTQFNVPISEVTETMMVTARVFHNLNDAGDAARAVLAVTRLDLVPKGPAENYLVGVAQATNMTRGSQLIDFVNSLNQLQATFGARVSQTLPGVARALPAATAAGLTTHETEALVALGVRAGQTGPQVGTGIIRAVTNFMFSPGGEIALGRYGVNPQVGQGGDAFRQIFDMIDRRQREGRLTGNDIRNISQAVGGPLLGGRIFAPIFEQEALRPGLYSGVLGGAAHPRSFQEDLDQVLSTVSERFKAIGIALQNFGSQLYQAGFLTPITGLLDAFATLTHVITAFVSPVTDAMGALGQISPVVRDAVGVLATFAALRYLSTTRLGGTASQFIGRLPGYEEMRAGPGAVQGIQGQLETYLVPQARGEVERSSTAALRANRAHAAALASLESFAQENAGAAVLPLGTAGRQAYETGIGDRKRTAAAAAAKAEAAEEEYATAAQTLAELEAQLVILKDRSLSWATRQAFAEEQGYVTSRATVNLKEDAIKQYRTGLTGEGSLAGAGAVATAGGVGAAAVTVAKAVAKDQGAMQDLQAAVAPPTPRAPATAGAPAAAAAAAMPIFREMQRNYGLAGGELPTAAARRAQAMPPEATPQAAESVGAVRQLAALGATSVMALGSRAQEYLATTATNAKSLFGLATGPGAPMAALIGTQLLGGAIGGGVGNLISQVGGTAASGALMAQMLGKSTAGGAAIGTVLGAIQAGGGVTPSNLMGVGAGVGTAIGAGLGLLTTGPFAELGVPAGAFIGGAVGTGAGWVAQNVLGLGGGKPKSQQDITAEANRKVAQIMQGGTPQQQMALFGADFEQQMLDSLFQTGGTQQKGQAGVGAIISNLTAQQQLFGLGGPLGQGRSTQQLETTIRSAINIAQQNPAGAQQIIQAAQQPYMGSVQQQFTAGLSQATSPAQAQMAVTTAQQALQSLTSGAYDAAVGDAQDQLNSARSQLDQALKSGSAKTIYNAAKAYDNAKYHVTAAQNLRASASQANQAALQAAAASALQQETSDNASSAQLQSAQAGGDAMKQLQAGALQAQRDMTAALTTQGLSPHDRQQAINRAQTEQLTNWTQQVQTQGQRVQAGAQLAAARGAVPGDPVATARGQITATETYLDYLKRNAASFDPTAIVGVETQLAQQRTALVQSQADQAVQLTTLAGGMAAARHYGDSVAQAQDVAGAARRVVGQTLGPVAQQQAQLQAVQAQNAVFDAQRQRVQAQGQFAQALRPNDSVAQAQIMQQVAGREMELAHGYDQQLQAATDMANANNQLSSALQSRITTMGQITASEHPNDTVAQAVAIRAAAGQALANARGLDAHNSALLAYNQANNQVNDALYSRIQSQGQLAASQHPGDAVAQARATRDAAARSLAAAHGIDQVTAATTAYNSANDQLNQALVNRDSSLGAFVASTKVEPIDQLTAQIRAARRAVADAKGPDARRTQQTNLNNLLLQREQTASTDRETTINFEFQMMQISASSAARQLRALAHAAGTTRARRQQLLEEARRYELGLESPIGGSGGFDLAPGNPRLPTFYDVRRAIGGRPLAQVPTMSHAIDASSAVTINVNVNRNADVGQVADVIDRTTGSHLRQRLRAAGVR